MEVIVILILVSLVLAGGFLGVFIWAARSGQYEDTTTPAMRILAEDSAPPPKNGRASPPSPTNHNP